MSSTPAILAAALAIAITTGTAHAAEPTKPMEKCYGVSQVGKNDC